MHPAKPTIVAVFVLALAGTTAAHSLTAADAAFLQSLAESGQQPLIQEDDPIAGGMLAPIYKSCSIFRDCGGEDEENVVACVGDYSCADSTKGVTCDSTEYVCPLYCSMQWTCPVQCPGYSYWCSSLKGDCGVTADGCDGRPQLCLCPAFGD